MNIKRRILGLMAMAGIASAMTNSNEMKLIAPELYQLPPMLSIRYGSNPIFIPRHGKFKGYMRENRKCTFNKNR